MNKKNLLLTTIVCMFPLILGVVLYSELPLKIAIHWDSTGIADRYCNKLLAIIGLPIFFALINLVVYQTVSSSKKENNNDILKVIGIWICPTISLIVLSSVFLISAGLQLSISLIVQTLIAVLIIIVGNYLPKSNPEKGIGMRLPWIKSTDVWKKVHRLTGYMWMLGGLCILVGAFIHQWIIELIAFVFIGVIPIIISLIVANRK